MGAAQTRFTGMRKREGLHASLISYHARLGNAKNVSAGISERQALSNLIRFSRSRDPIMKYDSLSTLSRYTIYAEDHTKKATTIGAHPNPSLSSESPSAPINSTENGVGKTATMLKTGFAPKRKFLAW
jgi:hypothetical protein